MKEKRWALSGHSNLIKSTIRQRQQVYYLITEETLKAIKEKNITADIMMLITSLLFGAFFSVFIALNTSIDLKQEVVNSLTVYQWMFFGFGIVFSVMTTVAMVVGNKLIKSITKSETTIVSDNDY